MTERKEEQGLSLLDIGTLAETVTLTNGKKLLVYGISVEGLFGIFNRFPEVGKWFKGGKLEMKDLIEQAPAAIAAIIAAGSGFSGNEEAETKAALIPVESQLDILEVLVRLTFKSGFGPFVQRIVALSKAAESLSFGRVPDMMSRPVPKNASSTDTPKNASGK